MAAETILIVSEQAMALAPILEQAGYLVLVTPSIEAFLEQATEVPGLAVVRLTRDSFDEPLRSIARLKTQAAWQEVPLLALAGPGVALDEPRAVRAGFLAVLPDQASPETVLALVRAHLALRRLERSLDERVAARTRELSDSNAALRAELAERGHVEDELRFSNTVLQTQQGASLDGILVVDGNGKILSFNQRFLDMWGFPAELVQPRLDEQLLGYAAQRVVDPEKFLERIRHIYASRSETSRDEIALQGDVTFERYSAPLLDRGTYLGRVWFFRDITTRRRAEAALRESEARYRRLVDMANEGVCVLDADYRIRFVNDQFARMLGLPKDELCGESFASFLLEEDLPDHEQRMMRRRAGQAEQYERRFRRRDGQLIWTIIAATPLFDEHGLFAGSFGMITDITERKHMEVALEEERRLFIGGKTVVFRWRNAPGWPMEYVSPNVEAQFGYSTEWLTRAGTSYSNLVHPDDIERVGAEVACYSEEQRESFEQCYRLRRADGQYRWVDDFTVPERDASGEITHYHGYLVDVTDRKVAEDALIDSEERLKAVVHGSPIPQFVIDHEHRVLFWNQALERITGVREDELRGTTLQWKPFYDSPRPTMADLFVDQAEQNIPLLYPTATRSTVVANSYEVTAHFPKLGKGYWLRFSGAPIRSPQGKVVGAVETLEDVTERVHAEQERERLLDAERAARQQAERVGRVKDEFLATLSHEMRTPLNAILGWAGVLRTAATRADGEVETTLRRIERNARSLAGIVDDLLDMSRIISGQTQLDVQAIDLVAAIESALESIRPAAEAKGIRLESRLDPAARKFYGDAGRLQQVVWNLVSNAVKFTPRGGWVEVEARHLGSHVEIEVRDSGIGIKPEFLPHVFERFSQADSTITRRFGGLGLGLAIVRHLVEMHGGTVQARSQGENRGATFRVVLPVEATRTEELIRVPARRPQTEAEPGEVDLTGVRVLVVDDEPDARELVRWVLEEQHAEVEAAGSAAEAFESFSRHVPDVVVSDIAMPVEDGYSLIRRLRSLPPERGGRVPALALTALVRQEDKTHALQAGFQNHMPKPIEPQALVEEIGTLARRAHVARA